MSKGPKIGKDQGELAPSSKANLQALAIELEPEEIAAKRARIVEKGRSIENHGYNPEFRALLQNPIMAISPEGLRRGVGALAVAKALPNPIYAQAVLDLIRETVEHEAYKGPEWQPYREALRAVPSAWQGQPQDSGMASTPRADSPEPGCLQPEDQGVLAGSADATAGVSRLARDTSKGGPGAPGPPNPFGAEGWRYSPDPEKLSLGVHRVQALWVTNEDYLRVDPDTQEMAWTWMRTDLWGDFRHLNQGLEDLEAKLLELAAEVGLDFVGGGVLSHGVGDSQWEDDRIEFGGEEAGAVEAEIQAIRAEHPGVAGKMSAVVEEMKKLHQSLEALRKEASIREEEGLLPNDGMEGPAWELVDIPEPETYARDLDRGYKQGLGAQTEILSKDGKAYLCVVSQGDSPSSEVAQSFVALGFCPPIEVASRWLRDYGQSEMQRAIQEGDARGIERIQVTARACVRTLDRVLFDANLDLQKLGEMLALVGDNDTIASAHARYPGATLSGTIGAMEKAIDLLNSKGAPDAEQFLGEALDKMRGGASLTQLIARPSAPPTMEGLKSSFAETERIALELLEARARKVLTEYPDLKEFVMGMGTAFFTTENEKNDIRPGDAGVARGDQGAYPGMKPVADLLSEWDEFLHLTGTPMRFTASGPKVTDW